MLSAIISTLIFVVPIAIFLAVQFMSQRSRTRSHWPQPGTAKQPRPITDRPRRRARVRASGGPSCGREFTHAMLTLVGARDSCRGCAALAPADRAEVTDLIAEAERIVNEAQD